MSWSPICLFFLVTCAFGDVSNKSLPNPMSWSFYPMLSSKSFIVLVLTFRSLIHFELIVVFYFFYLCFKLYYFLACVNFWFHLFSFFSLLKVWSEIVDLNWFLFFIFSFLFFNVDVCSYKFPPKHHTCCIPQVLLLCFHL